ncbi:hypothetical protein N665_0089s0086 [Sinapis alba]|nr:hypothetical protein N665_0089s0086 [Sinapis alba]
MDDLVGLFRIRVKRGINLVSRESHSCYPFVVITMRTDLFRMTTWDGMEDAVINIRPCLEAQRMGFHETCDGTLIYTAQPSRENCLAEENNVISSNGKMVQDMFLTLRNVGGVEIQIEWIGVPWSDNL